MGSRFAGLPAGVRATFVVASLVSAGVALGLAFFSNLPSVWHTTFVVGSVVAAGVCALTPWRLAWLKLAGAAGITALVGFAAWVMWSASTLAIGWPAAALGVVPVAALAVLGRRRQSWESPAAAASVVLAAVLVTEVVAVVAGTVIVSRFVYSYDLATLEGDRRRIAAEPGVEILIDAVASGRSDARSLAVDGERAAVAFSNSSGTGASACTLVWPATTCVHAGIESVSIDPARERVCAVGTRRGEPLEGHLFCARFDGAEPADLALPAGLGLAGTFDRARDRLYVVHELGSLTVAASEPLGVVAHLPLGLYHPDAAVPVWSADRLVARSSDGFVASVNLDDLTVTRRFLGPLAVGLGVGASESRREVYVGEMVRPVVRVLEAASLAEVRRLRVARGIRPIADLGDTGWLACGGVYDGMLYVVDALTGTLVSKTFVGKLVRAVAYDPGRRAVLVASRAGLIRVALPPPRSS